MNLPTGSIYFARDPHTSITEVYDGLLQESLERGLDLWSAHEEVGAHIHREFDLEMIALERAGQGTSSTYTLLEDAQRLFAEYYVTRLRAMHRGIERLTKKHITLMKNSQVYP